MPYILYHATHGPIAYIDAPAHAAVPGEDEIVIPCEENADVNDAPRWAAALEFMRESGLPAPGMELAQDYIRGMFTEHIQRRLDLFAAGEGRSYDNMLSLCTYATSANPVFRLEGQYGVEMRDATWLAANAIMNAVLAGERAIPTWEELEAELPPLAWPE